VTLYVAASDLIPEVNRSEEKNPIVSVIVFGGVALFYVLHRLIPRGRDTGFHDRVLMTESQEPNAG
jgi:zinc transporter ZupT